MNNCSGLFLSCYMKASLRCIFRRLTSFFCWISDALLWTTLALIFQVLEQSACLIGGFCRSSIKIMPYTRPMTWSLLGVLYLFTGEHFFQTGHSLVCIATVAVFGPDHPRVRRSCNTISYTRLHGREESNLRWLAKNPFKIPEPSGGVSFKMA